MDKRGSGILLYITSLPSSHGIRDLGSEAYRCADFFGQTKQRYWQVLPLNPIDPAYGSSPYSSVPAFAGDTLLVSPDLLLEEGFLSREDLDPIPPFPEARCDFPEAIRYKDRLLERAYQRFEKPGTHDNNTIRGWFEEEASPEDKRRLFRYLGRKLPVEEIHWALIRLAMMSVARSVILPMQDVLGLGGEARMNRPSIAQGNWEWRLLPGQITPQVSEKLLELTEILGGVEEMDLLDYLLKQHSRVSVERVVSGPGLFNIYQFP